MIFPSSGPLPLIIKRLQDACSQPDIKSLFEVWRRHFTKSLILLARPRGFEPCYRRERATKPFTGVHRRFKKFLCRKDFCSYAFIVVHRRFCPYITQTYA